MYDFERRRTDTDRTRVVSGGGTDWLGIAIRMNLGSVSIMS
jgi:hypothetical protein